MTERPLRVAYIIDTIADDRGGTERQLLETLRRWDRRRVIPHLICLRSSPWLERHSLPADSTILGYRGFFSRNIGSLLWELRRVLAAGQFDVVQTFFEDAFVATVGATVNWPRRPVLLASRRDIGLGAEHPWYHRFFRWIRPWLLKRCDGVLANAEAVRKDVVQSDGLAPDRIRVVPNGIKTDLQAYPPPPLFASVANAQWIVLAANLRPIKRHDLFLKALSQLRSTPQAPIHAAFLGAGSEETDLRRLARHLGVESRVHFAGAVDNVIPYFQHASLGVLCSDKEGFSNAILEALANGLPMVVTAVGGNPELVDDTVGAVVPPGDADALAAALTRLLSDASLRSQMSQAARARIKERYSWERTLTALEDQYRTFCCSSTVKKY